MPTVFDLSALPQPEVVRLFRGGEFFAFGKHHSYRLGPAPHFASYSMKRGKWWPDASAAEKILDLFEVVSAPRFAVWSNQVWCERSSGQGLMPWAEGNTAELARSRFYDHYLTYQSTIDPGARALVKRFRSHVIPALRLLSACPEAMSLARENPALFILVADHFNEWSAAWIDRDEVLALIRGRKVEILERQGLPKREVVRKFLGKIPAAFVGPVSARTLSRAVLQPRLRKYLPHLKQVGGSLVMLLSEKATWGYLTPQLLREVSRGNEAEAEFRSAGLLWRLTALHELDIAKGNTPRPLRSRAEVFAASDGAVGFPTTVAFTPEEIFPPPPLPGNDWIVPITTVCELRDEGRMLQNCAGDQWQAGAVMAGLSYFYKVRRPERATLQISRMTEDAPWIVTEIRTLDNGVPRMRTVQFAVDTLGLSGAPAWHPDSPHWVLTPYPFMPRPRSVSESSPAPKDYT